MSRWFKSDPPRQAAAPRDVSAGFKASSVTAPKILRQGSFATTEPKIADGASPQVGSAFMMAVAAMVLLTLAGRIFDRILVGYHLPAIICAAALVVSLVKGRVSGLTNRIAIPLLGLIMWMLICTPFSTWRGGSASAVVYFSFFSLMWLPISLGPRNLKDINRLILLVGILNVVTLLLTKVDATGRLQGDGGTYSNSEDIALIAIFSIPLWTLIAGQIRGPILKTLVAAVSTLFLLISAAKTGSRAGIIGAGGMGLFYFLRGSVSNKILLVLATVVTVVCGLFFVPQSMLQRLSTINESFGVVNTAAARDNEALGSAAGRQQLLFDSIRITLQHPLFGVGPGQFAEFRWGENHSVGFGRGYYVTHNTYTQISSEDGIPGLVFFLGLLIGTYRTIRSARKLNTPNSHKDWRACQALATGLELSFTCIVIFGFFTANAQYIFWYLIGGLALALERVTIQSIGQARTTKAGVEAETTGLLKRLA